VKNSWCKAFPTSDPLDFEAGERFKKRVGRLTDPHFVAACSLAGIDPSPRQARKWNNGKGLARRFRNKALQEL
jgi:hypothetical protein